MRRVNVLPSHALVSKVLHPNQDDRQYCLIPILCLLQSSENGKYAPRSGDLEKAFVVPYEGSDVVTHMMPFEYVAYWNNGKIIMLYVGNEPVSYDVTSYTWIHRNHCKD